MGILLNYGTLCAAGILLIFVSVCLIKRRKRPISHNAVLLTILFLLLLYFAFVLWAVVGFSSPSPAEPIPIPASR